MTRSLTTTTSKQRARGAAHPGTITDSAEGPISTSRAYEGRVSVAPRRPPLLETLPRSVADAATLVGTTLAAQAVLLVSTPILTRLYGPEHFGAYAVYLMLLAIPLVFVSWRYELAIPVVPAGSDAAHLLVASLFLVGVTSSFLAICLAVAGQPLVVWLRVPELYPYLWLAPASLLLAGCVQAWSYLAIRRKAFFALAGTRMSQTAAQVFVQVACGLFSGGLAGLVSGDLLGRAQCATFATIWTWRHQREVFNALRPQMLFRVLLRYRQYSLLLSGASLFNCLSQNMPIVFLASRYGIELAGAYALAQRVTQYPLTLVGNAVGQVFLSRARDDQRHERLAETTRRIYRILLAIGLPFAFLILLSGSQLFALVFGSRWTIAGQFTTLMSPWLLAAFIGSPLSSLIVICNRQRGELIFQAGLFSARALAMTACLGTNNPQLAVGLFGAVSAVFWCGYLVWLLRIAGNRAASILSDFLRELVGIAPAIVPLAIVRMFSTDVLLISAVTCMAAVVVAARFLVIQGASLTEARTAMLAAKSVLAYPASLGSRQ